MVWARLACKNALEMRDDFFSDFPLLRNFSVIVRFELRYKRLPEVVSRLFDVVYGWFFFDSALHA
jgi:hypothetical protein